MPDTIYHVDSRKCACKGTGLIQLDSKIQCYCPVHRIKRDWPQMQADGSYVRIPLKDYNRSIP